VGNERQGDSDRDDTRDRRGDKRTTAEWITTAVSALLIGALAGAIIYEGYARSASAPARIETTVLTGDAERRGDRYYVPIEVVNAGDETVEEATIAIDVRDGDELVVETEATIATLSEAERATIQLVIDRDPAGLEIEARVVSFQVAEE
jgi:uncharacterized protein (TIGR02588 family)